MFAFIRRMILTPLSPENRDLLHAMRRYSLLTGKRKANKQYIISLVDGRKYHGGFCDRMKGIVSLFHYSLAKGIPYKIHYTYPFRLTDYLVPNLYDWAPDEAPNTNFFSVKFLYLVGDPSVRRLARLNTRKQIQAYGNRDIVDKLNTVYGTSYAWGELFQMLFQPAEDLQADIVFHKKRLGEEYVCAVFRFQNLLGDFIEYDFPSLPAIEQEIMINKNKEFIRSLKRKYPDQNLLVTSDSVRFLKELEGMEGVYTLPGRVVHMDSVSDAGYDVYKKSFLDFFMLAGGKKIYSVGTKEMYETEFPLYAAKLNGIPFERALVD